MAAVGIIVNPHAGKDIRRLVSPAGHTSDAAKIGVVRRVAAAALAAGAERVLIGNDAGRLGGRALAGLADHGLPAGGAVEVLDDELTGSRLDSVRAAARLRDAGCAVVVVIGGDGTCRDAATGWNDMPMIALSTGTNNVFPMAIDATAAGTAAGLVASGAVPVDRVATRVKRLLARIDASGQVPREGIALVDVGLINAAHTGARAVLDGRSVRAVVAAVSTPASTGLASIPGRLAPLAEDDPHAVVVDCSPGGRGLLVPLLPGVSSVVGIERVSLLAPGDVATYGGPVVLAFDGERDEVAPAGSTISISVDRCGPRRIDVEATLVLAAEAGLFFVASNGDQPPD